MDHELTFGALVKNISITIYNTVKSRLVLKRYDRYVKLIKCRSDKEKHNTVIIKVVDHGQMSSFLSLKLLIKQY